MMPIILGIKHWIIISEAQFWHDNYIIEIHFDIILADHLYRNRQVYNALSIYFYKLLHRASSF